MFNFKSKKVFEKINKMNRKQAYTIGAIVVVVVVVLILLVSAMGEEDDSFADMNARGYDLAQMPFATDEAEKYLLANAYPDMQENGSSLLYSAQEKEARQELEITQFEEDEDEDEDEGSDYGSSEGGEDGYGSGSGSSRGYGGYGGHGGYGGSGGGKTEIGQLSSAGMASAGGSGINSTYGPTGDFRQFKGREDKGKEKPIQLKTDDARRSLAQFRQGSLASARMNENKMKNAGRALFGGNVQGSDAFKKDGTVDLDKLKEGGFTLDTSAPSTTTDLNNLDKKVADATNKAQDKKKEEEKKKKWWEEMLIDLAKSSAKLVIDSFLGTAMDTLTSNISASNARRGAKNGVYNDESDLLYARAASGDPDALKQIYGENTTKTKDDFTKDYKNSKSFRKTGTGIVKTNPDIVQRANDTGQTAYEEQLGRSSQAAADRAAKRAEQKSDDSQTNDPCNGGGYTVEIVDGKRQIKCS